MAGHHSSRHVAEFMWSIRASTFIEPDPNDKFEALLPLETMSHTATPFGGANMCIFGGTAQSALDFKKSAASDKLYVFDMVTQRFHLPQVRAASEEDRPKARYGHTAVIDEDSGDMYVFGGASGDLVRSPPDSDVFRLYTGGKQRRTTPLKCCPVESAGTGVPCAIKLAWEKVKVSKNNRPQQRSVVRQERSEDERQDKRKSNVGGKGELYSDVWTLNLKLGDGVEAIWERIENKHVKGESPLDTTKAKAIKIGSSLYCVDLSCPGSSVARVDELELTNPRQLKWKKIQVDGVPPTPRTRQAMAPYKALGGGQECVLIVGGSAVEAGEETSRPLNDIHLLSKKGKRFRWEWIVANGHTPYPRYGHTIGQWGNRTFMFGGHTSTAITRDMTQLVHQKWLDTGAGANGDIPAARIGASGTVIGDNLYIIGGAVNQRPTNDIFIFHAKANAWSSPLMHGLAPVALVGHCAGAVKTEIFVYGGSDGETPNDQLFTIDTVKKRWHSPPVEGSVPKGGVGCTMIALGPLLYVYGGYGQRTYSDDVAILNTSAMTWSHPEQKGSVRPRPRVGHTATLIGDEHMIVFGGSHQGKQLNDTWALTVGSASNTVKWDQLRNTGGSAVPKSRFGHAACAVGRQIYIVGGAIKLNPKKGEGKTGEAKMGLEYRSSVDNHVYIMKPRVHEMTALWTCPVLGDKLPDGRYRHVAIQIDGVVFMFGGSHGSQKLMWGLDTGYWHQAIVGSSKRQCDGKASAADTAMTVVGAGTDDRDKLARFLDKHNLSKYTRVFNKQEVDWDVLKQCNDDDLCSIGIRALGPRKKILKEVSKLEMSSKFIVDPAMMADEGHRGKPVLFAGRYEIVGVPPRVTNPPTTKTHTIDAVDIRHPRRRPVVLKLVDDKKDWSREVEVLRDMRGAGTAVELYDYEGREQRLREKRSTRDLGPEDDGAGRGGTGAEQTWLGGKGEGAHSATKEDVQPDFVPGTDMMLWDHYDAWVADGYHWIVLERGDRTLRDVFRDSGVMYETQRRALFERLCIILRSIHDRGLVHCDVKPENLVFFGEAAVMKMIDFGIAAKEGDRVPPRGTPAYCSPEMAAAFIKAHVSVKPKVVTCTNAMDVWAAGMILWEMYIGRPILDHLAREDPRGGDLAHRFLEGVYKGNVEKLESLPWGVIHNPHAMSIVKATLARAGKKRPSMERLLAKTEYLLPSSSTLVEKQFGKQLGDKNRALLKRLTEIEDDATHLVTV